LPDYVRNVRICCSFTVRGAKDAPARKERLETVGEALGRIGEGRAVLRADERLYRHAGQQGRAFLRRGSGDRDLGGLRLPYSVAAVLLRVSFALLCAYSAFGVLIAAFSARGPPRAFCTLRPLVATALVLMSPLVTEVLGVGFDELRFLQVEVIAVFLKLLIQLAASVLVLLRPEPAFPADPGIVPSSKPAGEENLLFDIQSFCLCQLHRLSYRCVVRLFWRTGPWASSIITVLCQRKTHFTRFDSFMLL
jgi:hypothetical protein